MYAALLAMFHLCGAQVGTDLHQGKLQIGKSGNAVVPAFVTELCFRAGGCEEITTPPEVGISRIFVSPDFSFSRDWLEGRAGENPDGVPASIGKSTVTCTPACSGRQSCVDKHTRSGGCYT
jgi:hypothetical protein